MPPQTTTPPGATARKRRRHQRADRREDDRRIELVGRHGGRITGPHRAQPQRERLRLGIAGLRERVDLLVLVHGNLRDDVRGRAEAVEAKPLDAFACHPIRTIADQPRTEQGRGLRKIVAFGQTEAVALIGHGVVGIAAVKGVAGEAGGLAQIFLARGGSNGIRRTSSPATARRPDRRS